VFFKLPKYFIDLSSCILFAVMTLGSPGRIGFLPPGASSRCERQWQLGFTPRE